MSACITSGFIVTSPPRHSITKPCSLLPLWTLLTRKAVLNASVSALHGHTQLKQVGITAIRGNKSCFVSLFVFPARGKLESPRRE